MRSSNGNVMRNSVTRFCMLDFDERPVVNWRCPAQVLYNAQMIRTWSLLLRNAQRLNYIVSGRQVGPSISFGL